MLKGYGQLNEVDTLRWHMRFSANGLLLEGNISRLLLLGRLEVANANAKMGLSTRNDYQYGTKNQLKSEDDISFI